MKLKFNAREHSYWLNGRRAKGATSAAKIPDDLYRLHQWDRRMDAIGFAKSPPLVERAAAHINDRDELNAICDEAKAIAKAHEASGRGTAAHRITEAIDLGEEIVDTALAQAVQATWSAALDDAGLDIIPELIERIVVYPEHHLCGTFDRICRRRSDGKLVIVDLKTGVRAVEYPHAPTIQAAIYAYAPLLAGALPKGGGTTEHFEPLPDLDHEVGYMVHMPAENLATVKEIDIAAGWEAFQNIVIPTWKWRARKNLIRDQISAAVWAPSPRLVTEDGTVEPPSAPVVPVPSTTEPTKITELAAYKALGGPHATPDPQRIEWIRTWIRQISDIDQLARRWTADIATPRGEGWRRWTNEDIDRIAAMCAEVDALNDAPLWPPDPSTPTPTSIQTRS